MNAIKRAAYASIIFALVFSRALSADIADELIEVSGVQGGLVVVLDNERITSEMRVNDRYLVQGLFKDERSKTSAREKIQSKGIYGPVTVKSWKGKCLPYLDNMVNLIVAEDHSSVPLEEIFRVLAPYGVLLSKKEIKIQGSRPVDGWHRAVKPWPDTIDEWTHWMHAPDNNAVSQDTYKNIPRGLQWIQPWNRCQARRNSLRIWLILPDDTRNFRAAVVVVSPIARNLAMRRNRVGRDFSHAAKSTRMAATWSGPTCLSSTTASCQVPSSLSYLSNRSTVTFFWRRPLESFRLEMVTCHGRLGGLLRHYERKAA